MFRALAVVIALAAAPVLSVAAEKMDNPEFKAWSQQKAGTIVTYKATNDFGGMKSETTITNKLIEVGAEKAVVETSTVTTVAGMEIKGPATKRDVLKSVDVPAGKKPDNIGKPEGTFEEGTEDVKVGGTTYKTKWYKFKTEKPVKAQGQIWTSDEVPGQLVKMVTKLEGQVTGSTTMELVEVKK